MADMEDDGLLLCDICKMPDTPDGFAYIGPKDQDTTTCNPFMGLTGNWVQICWKCEGAKTT